MLKLADLAKSHGSISTVTYSHKYRVSTYFTKRNVALFGHLNRLQVHLF